MKDKEESTTAVTSGTPPEDRNKASLTSPSAGGGFTAHKPGEGYATRLGMMVVLMAFVAFACHRWYYNWSFVREMLDGFFTGISKSLGFITAWTFEPWASTALGLGGTVLIAVGGFMLGYYFVYCKRNSAEFLVKTDSELGKVAWPAVTPWFKPETKVWGATYVVLIFVALMAIYVFAIDYILNVVSQWAFYS